MSLMLTDTLTRELSGVGPEDVPREEQLKKLRSTLELQVQKKSSVVIFVEGTVKKKKVAPSQHLHRWKKSMLHNIVTNVYY